MFFYDFLCFKYLIQIWVYNANSIQRTRLLSLCTKLNSVFSRGKRGGPMHGTCIIVVISLKQ